MEKQATDDCRIMYNNVDSQTDFFETEVQKDMEKQLTMLLVDDMEINRASLKSIFSPEYQVLEAENGQEAMDIMKDNRVDIVILDLFMPVKNGFDVIREMKASETLKDIPIVVKTAMDENTEEKALELGADEYIFSPGNPAVIVKRVHNIVRKYILEKEKIKRQLEEEQQMNHTKELFLARMSHELRTPINSILGISQLARSRDPKVQRDFKIIRAQAEYLLALVGDVLDMASIDNDRLTLHTAVFPLHTLIAEVSDLFFDQCRQKKIKFNFRVKNIREEYLVGDIVRIKQILINLLSNAIKFTDADGRVEACVEEERMSENQIMLILSVRDTGCGISEEALPKIWQPFEQEEHTGGVYYGGSGLGLPITKSIAERMNGTIDLETKKGEGSRFTVRLPLEVGAAVSKEKRKYKSLKVFLVNQDEISVHYMIATLARLGISYTSEYEEKKVMDTLLEAYESGKGYDICFINWQMQDGYAKKITEKIRHKFDRDTLKIVISSYHPAEFEDDMRMAGADYIIGKPVLQSQIYQLISDICSIPEEEVPFDTDLDFEGKTVLLAEDNAVNAEVMTAFLNRVNLKVEHAGNGEAAVACFKCRPDGYYSAVFMDINMPVMDGYEAARQIRNSEKADAASIPVIAVTANAFSSDIVRIHEAGMNTCVLKPIEKTVLYETLGKYL